ncbi:glycosyltransferase [Laspinema olomoucense]|uniref:glycosyltransferase n=1 Tax=Laspinema olomoucense TaxID=3231600 RepID=UPI0021BB96B1|nr:glycosyltransferase [Laspinema sp. D3a]MCT7990848.1 glycosyltransferase [Laspinema sp. D3a]
MGDLDTPFVSVIIPVFNDLERLVPCLQSLENQTYSKKSYEVIVIDNGSDEEIKSVDLQFGQVVFTEEKEPGSYAARNKGISLAQGEIFAFTDSDCIPHPDWIEKGVDNLLRVNNCGLVGGKIHIFFKDTKNPTAVELYDSVMAFPQKNYIEGDKFAVSANLFTFRAVFEKVGLFDTKVKSGGDYNWGRRVFAAGYQLIYAPDVCVDHPARSSFKDLYKKIVRVIGGQYDLSQNSPIYPSNKFLKLLFRDLIPPLKFSLSILSSQEVKEFDKKIKIIAVRWYVKYARAWERAKFQFKVSKVRER